MGKQGIRKRKKKRNVTVSQRSTTLRFIRNNFAWFSYGLTYFIIISMILMLMLAMSGCGHTITHTDRGTGLIARIPLPDGSSLIDLKVGKIDSTTTVLRGNSTYDSSASTGGTLFGSASTSDRTFVATGIQLNEGYLKDVLTSPDVDPATKVALAQAIVQVKAAQSKPTVTKSVGAATSTGETPPTEVEPVAVGLDNVVNRVAEVTPKVVEPVAKATAEVVKDAAVTTQKVSKDWSNVMNRWWIIALAGLIIVGAVVAFVLKRYKKKTEDNKQTTDESVKDQAAVEDDINAKATDPDDAQSINIERPTDNER